MFWQLANNDTRGPCLYNTVFCVHSQMFRLVIRMCDFVFNIQKSQWNIIINNMAIKNKSVKLLKSYNKGIWKSRKNTCIFSVDLFLPALLMTDVNYNTSVWQRLRLRLCGKFRCNTRNNETRVFIVISFKEGKYLFFRSFDSSLNNFSVKTYILRTLLARELHLIR